jgi:hypothetical protein
LIFDAHQTSIPIQFSEYWTPGRGEGTVTDNARLSSPIIELGAENPRAIALPNGKMSLTFDLSS